MKWAEDKDAPQCQQCNQPFSLARRKVHEKFSFRLFLFVVVVG